MNAKIEAVQQELQEIKKRRRTDQLNHKEHVSTMTCQQHVLRERMKRAKKAPFYRYFAALHEPHQVPYVTRKMALLFQLSHYIERDDKQFMMIREFGVNEGTFLKLKIAAITEEKNTIKENLSNELEQKAIAVERMKIEHEDELETQNEQIEHIRNLLRVMKLDFDEESGFSKQGRETGSDTGSETASESGSEAGSESDGSMMSINMSFVLDGFKSLKPKEALTKVKGGSGRARSSLTQKGSLLRLWVD